MTADEIREAHRKLRDADQQREAARLHLANLLTQANQTMSLEEIARVMNVSRQRVHSIIIRQRTK